MAPEIFEVANKLKTLKPQLSLEEGKKCDIFSVGIIIGQIFLEGLHPFGGLDALYAQINIREDNKKGLKVCYTVKAIHAFTSQISATTIFLNFIIVYFIWKN